jgi:hypothetical protein
VATADNGDDVDVDEVDEDVDDGKTHAAIYEAYIDVEVVAEGHYHQLQVEPAAEETKAQQ